MGNLSSCFLPSNPLKENELTKPFPRNSPPTSYNWTRTRSRRYSSNYSNNSSDNDDLIREQALAAAALLKQYQKQQNGSVPGLGSLSSNRSASLRYPKNSGTKKGQFARSTTSRPRSLTDPVLQPHQLVSKETKLDNLETSQFVLVHGGGFGAWCWYKTMALLEESGFKVTAIDLTGCGIHSSDANDVTSLSQYVKPLTDLLEKLADEEKVILVGHDFGGVCISYAMELFPRKISKAIFVAAAMLTNGQSSLDVFSAQQETPNDLMRRAQVFVYANGNSNPPTAMELEKSLLCDLLFNQSSTKDIALASVSMRPIPFAPVLEKLRLSDAKYGMVKRYYIECLDDNAIPVALQERMISSSPPEKVFCLKGVDHSPFFSKPQALHRLLVEIAKIPSASKFGNC